MNRPHPVTTALRRGWKTLAWCLTAGLVLTSGSEALAQRLPDAAAAQPAPDQPIPEEQVYTEKMIAEGPGWQLRTISGVALNDRSGKDEAYSREVYTVNAPEGVAQLPISKRLQEELVANFAQSQEKGDTVLSIDKRIADELTRSEEMGELTPYLREIAEPADPDDGGIKKMGPFGSCSDSYISRSKSFSMNAPINSSTSFGSGFSGTFYTTGNITGSATGEVVIAVKRTKIWWVCIPYFLKFDHARAWGNASVAYGSTVNGTLNYTFSWQNEIAKPYLGSVDFMAGPIPVHIGFNLPINLGIDINASVTGTVQYNGQQTATGSFDYTCTLNGCGGYATYSLNGSNTPQPVTGSVSGRIYPTVWGQVAVRAYLYSEWLANAQVGIRPFLYGDLWGYYGNTCGDADGNGVNETVSALTFDLDWQLFITARASAIGYTREWNNLWSTGRRHLRFWDIPSGGSTALRPTLLGASSVPVNVSANYSSRMRPCWPYGDTMNSQFAWGDGTYASYSAAPSTTTTRAKFWTTAGAKNVSVTAISDSHGRTLNATTSRTVQVTGGSGTWTAWFSRDLPSGEGDFETLTELRNEGYSVCANPTAIECQTVGGAAWNTTGQVYSCSLPTGGVCVNSQQSGGAQCQDYRVRFLCP